MEIETLLCPADDAGIARAAALLRQGEILALPTETVYGIAADARNGTKNQRHSRRNNVHDRQIVNRNRKDYDNGNNDCQVNPKFFHSSIINRLTPLSEMLSGLQIM